MPPIPSSDLWVQYPLVAVIVLCFIVAFVGVFIVVKWVWGEYKKERLVDLTWRTEQNAARDGAWAQQNELWRVSVLARETRYEQFDRERHQSMKEMAALLAGLSNQLKDHDLQSKEILAVALRVEHNTQPLPRREP